jgi:hypothetical protein
MSGIWAGGLHSQQDYRHGSPIDRKDIRIASKAQTQQSLTQSENSPKGIYVKYKSECLEKSNFSLDMSKCKREGTDV